MLAVTLPKISVAQNRGIGNRNTFSFACLLQRKEEKVDKEGIEVERGKKGGWTGGLAGSLSPWDIAWGKCGTRCWDWVVMNSQELSSPRSI